MTKEKLRAALVRNFGVFIETLLSLFFELWGCAFKPGQFGAIFF